MPIPLPSRAKFDHLNFGSPGAKMVVGAGLGLVAAFVLLRLSSGEDREAAAILKQARQKYAALTFYSSDGKSLEEFTDGRTLAATFSIRLGRPDYYLIQYSQRGASLTNQGAVWRNGTGSYFANDLDGPLGRTTKWPAYFDLAQNVAGIADCSGGASAVIPPLFFAPRENSLRLNRWVKKLRGQSNLAWADWTQPARWTQPRLLKETDGRVGQVDCHVLSAEFSNGKAMLWIGKNDGLIRQSRQWVRGKVSPTTDAEVAQMLKGVSQPPLPPAEMKRRIDAGLKQAKITQKPVTLVFTNPSPPVGGMSTISSMTVQPPPVYIFTQTHENILINAGFSPTNFSRP